MNKKKTIVLVVIAILVIVAAIIGICIKRNKGNINSDNPSNVNSGENITNKNNIIKIEYNGNGFLLNMVRILTGTLIKVAKGELEPKDIKEMLKSKKRSEDAVKAPAKGLCMKEVNY